MRALALALLLLATGTEASPKFDRAVLVTISRMEAAWNRGEFIGYMAGFKNPDVVFVSTRPFRHGQGRWLITMNHVSAYDAAPIAPEAK